jgi:hypothetical protein
MLLVFRLLDKRSSTVICKTIEVVSLDEKQRNFIIIRVRTMTGSPWQYQRKITAIYK